MKQPSQPTRASQLFITEKQKSKQGFVTDQDARKEKKSIVAVVPAPTLNQTTQCYARNIDDWNAAVKQEVMAAKC